MFTRRVIPVNRLLRTTTSYRALTPRPPLVCRFDLPQPVGAGRGGQVGKSYAGRASVGPCLDLFITLLSMGEEGWKRLLAEREALVGTFR